MKKRSILSEIVLSTILFTGSGIAGLLIFTGFFAVGFLSQYDILFYRGLALAILSSAAILLGLSLLARRFRLTIRDIVSAAVLTLSVNTSFLVLFPVTIDRSITVFLLGYMANDRQRTFTAEEMSAGFKRIYVEDYHQIDRRLAEQVQSGNLVRSGDGFQLTSQGRNFIDLSRLLAWLFATDRRFVAPVDALPTNGVNQRRPR